MVILAVVVANAIIGYVQEGKAEKAMDAIRQMLAPRAAALRDGGRVTIDGADLVPGDIVLLEPGDKVPADLRLIEARGLAAQEAILTGESVPVDKTPDPVAPDAALGDRRSMLWSGTLVTQGTARGLVVEHIERWKSEPGEVRHGSSSRAATTIRIRGQHPSSLSRQGQRCSRHAF